jgi:hypothetical protein
MKLKRSSTDENYFQSAAGAAYSFTLFYRCESFSFRAGFGFSAQNRSRELAGTAAMKI